MTDAASSAPPSHHLMIATGQNLANLIPALQCGATQATVLQTPAMKASAAHLCDALRARGIVVHRTDFDDRDVQALHQQAEALAERLDCTPITINLTGGTKLMTLALVQTLARDLGTHANADNMPHMLYCDTAHQRLDWLAPTARSEPMRSVLRLDDILLAQGYRREDANGGAEAAERHRAAQDRADLTRWIGEQAGRLEKFFSKMNALASKAAPEGGPFVPRQSMDYAPGGLNEEWLRRSQAAALLHWDHDVGVAFTSVDGARYMGGGWAEELAALKISGLRPDDRASGLRVRHVDTGAENEIDAVAVHRNRLLVVECKAARTDDDADWIYKLSQLARQLGGQMARPMLLSARRFGEKQMARANEYGVTVLSGADLAKLPQHLRDWMTP